MKFPQDRFTITAHGKATLKIPTEDAKGARYMVAIKSPQGQEIGTRPFLSFAGANKVYDRLVAQLMTGACSLEHLNAD